MTFEEVTKAHGPSPLTNTCCGQSHVHSIIKYFQRSPGDLPIVERDEGPSYKLLRLSNVKIQICLTIPVERAFISCTKELNAVFSSYRATQVLKVPPILFSVKWTLTFS